MKKLIGLLAATGLIAGAGATAVSCGCGKEEADKDTKKAFDELLKGLEVKVVEADKAKPDAIKKAATEAIEAKQKTLAEGNIFKTAKIVEAKPDKLAEKETVIVMTVANDNKKVTLVGWTGVKEKEEVKAKKVGEKSLTVGTKPADKPEPPKDEDKKIDLSTNEAIRELVVEAGKNEADAKKVINAKMVKIKAELREGTDYEIKFGDALADGKTVEEKEITISAKPDSKLIKNDYKFKVSKAAA